MRESWNPVLVRCGYLPFVWDKENYFIRCIRLEKMPEEEKCGIYQIDHEVLFDFDEILHDRDCDSLQEASQKAVIRVLKEACGLWSIPLTFARYFVGQSYPNMLSTEQVMVGNVTFEPGCRNNCSAPPVSVTIRNGEKRQGNLIRDEDYGRLKFSV